MDQKQSLIENEIRCQQNYNGDWFLGIYVFSENRLQHAREIGQKIRLTGYGLVIIENHLNELVLETIENINIKGKLIASSDIKKHFQTK